jgi:ribokinase
MDVIALADHHPRVGETVMGSELRLLPGGKGSNQAVAARRSGVATSLVAYLGEDVFGEQLWRFLEEEDIDLEHTRSIAGASSGVALVVVAESNNSIVVVPGAGAQMQASALDLLDIRAGDVVVTQLEAPEPVTAAAIARANAVGAISVLNPAPALPAAARLLDDADVLILNETEVAAFSGAGDVAALADPAVALDAAAELRRHPGQLVVVTLGGAGAVSIGPDGPLRVDGRSVEVVDTTGAGDCFVGNLAAGLCVGRPVAEALEMANLAASLSVRTQGAAVSMPDARAVRAAAGVREEGGPGVADG